MKIKINVIYQDGEEGKKATQRRIAEFHADCIIEKINNLSWSYERKVELLEKVRNHYKRKEVS